MTRAIIKTLGVALVATLPMLASAQLTGNVSLTTNYKFRGQDQDASKAKAVKPALQGGFDYAFGDSGWYVGNWNSSVDWLANNSLEADLYGGYKFKAAGADLIETNTFGANRRKLSQLYLDDELERVRRVMAAWAYYRGALAAGARPSDTYQSKISPSSTPRPRNGMISCVSAPITW